MLSTKTFCIFLIKRSCGRSSTWELVKMHAYPRSCLLRCGALAPGYINRIPRGAYAKNIEKHRSSPSIFLQKEPGLTGLYKTAKAWMQSSGILSGC